MVKSYLTNQHILHYTLNTCKEFYENSIHFTLFPFLHLCMSSKSYNCRQNLLTSSCTQSIYFFLDFASRFPSSGYHSVTALGIPPSSSDRTASTFLLWYFHDRIHHFHCVTLSDSSHPEAPVRSLPIIRFC